MPEATCSGGRSAPGRLVLLQALPPKHLRQLAAVDVLRFMFQANGVGSAYRYHSNGRLAQMTDAELLEKTSRARGLAHRAPFAEWSKDHRGHSAIVHHTRAWADRSKEFFGLMDEVDRRGLKMPPCDCPPADHE